MKIMGDHMRVGIESEPVKPKFKFAELVFRVPVIALGLFFMFNWMLAFFQDENIQGLINFSMFWFGAWFWESVLFILHRLKIINVTKHW